MLKKKLLLCVGWNFKDILIQGNYSDQSRLSLLSVKNSSHEIERKCSFTEKKAKMDILL